MFSPNSKNQHPKLGTKAVAQIFVPYKERVEERKVSESRKIYNSLVWNRILRIRVVDKKLRNNGFEFQHEMTTDGFSASLLYSKPSSFCRTVIWQKEKPADVRREGHRAR